MTIYRKKARKCIEKIKLKRELLGCSIEELSLKLKYFSTNDIKLFEDNVREPSLSYVIDVCNELSITIESVLQ